MGAVILDDGWSMKTDDMIAIEAQTRAKSTKDENENKESFQAKLQKLRAWRPLTTCGWLHSLLFIASSLAALQHLFDTFRGCVSLFTIKVSAAFFSTYCDAMARSAAMGHLVIFALAALQLQLVSTGIYHFIVRTH